LQWLYKTIASHHWPILGLSNQTQFALIIHYQWESQYIYEMSRQILILIIRAETNIPFAWIFARLWSYSNTRSTQYFLLCTYANTNDCIQMQDFCSRFLISSYLTANSVITTKTNSNIQIFIRVTIQTIQNPKLCVYFSSTHHKHWHCAIQ